MTREEKNEYQRNWNKKNKDKKREHDRKYREKNKEHIKEITKIWRENNKEHINKTIRQNYKKKPEKFKARTKKYKDLHEEQIKLRNQEYKRKNKEKIRDYQRERRKNPIYRLKDNISSLIYISIKRAGYRKSKKTEQILGCTIEEFIDYLTSKFKEGMTLENHGEWHIDHIIPISTAKTKEEVIKLNHYTNLQPLWAIENLKKSNKIL